MAGDTDDDASPESSTAAHRGDSNSGRRFDTSLAAQHCYLGELDDLHGEGAAYLTPGQEDTLPLLPLDGVVLMPGALLPLWLLRRSELQTAEAALAAPPPLSRLLIVVCERWRRGISVLHAVGCLAEVRRLRRDDSGAMQAVARGSQRVELLSIAGSGRRATVRVLPDAEAQHLPREAVSGHAHLPPWAWRACDAFQLAEAARTAFASISPEGACGDTPLALSFWLAANLPLDDAARQRLLECTSAAERLYDIVHIMAALQLRCCECDVELAHAKDVINMSEEGIAALFVNPHGYVHDMVTLRKVSAVTDEGAPTAEHSWFHGYAWQLSYCERCLQHVGWCFSAVQDDLRPYQFWGIRRLAFAHCGIDTDVDQDI